jgi:uncharacterized protein (TIGR02996 family)
MEDFASLYAEIVRRPKDDLPRLVFCDALEEYGEDDHRVWAEAIRASVGGLETPVSWGTCPDGFAIPSPIPKACLVQQSRGFLSKVETFSENFRMTVLAIRNLAEVCPISDVALKAFRPLKRFDNEFLWVQSQRDWSLPPSGRGEVPSPIWGALLTVNVPICPFRNSYAASYETELEAIRALEDAVYSVSANLGVE